MAKMKKRKLKNLKIDSISMVIGENASPMNPGAKTLFIKSKKEDNSMENGKNGFLAFLETFFNKSEVKKAEPETPPAETPETEQEEKDYVTKSDFEQFKVEVAEIIKQGMVQKADTETDKISEFAKGLHTAYQAEIEALKKSFVKQESAGTAVGNQTGLIDLIKNYAQKEQANSGNDRIRKGQAANDFVKKKMDEGVIKQQNLPGIKTDFDLVVEEICNL